MKKPAQKPAIVQLTKEERAGAAALLKRYLDNNLEIEIGQLQSELLLDYINSELGGYFYNKAVADAMQFMNEKTEDLVMLMKD